MLGVAKEKRTAILRKIADPVSGGLPEATPTALCFSPVRICTGPELAFHLDCGKEHEVMELHH